MIDIHTHNHLRHKILLFAAFINWLYSRLIDIHVPFVEDCAWVHWFSERTPCVYMFKPCINHFTRYTHPLQPWIRPKPFSVCLRLAVVCLLFHFRIFESLSSPHSCSLLLSHLTYNSSCCYGHGHLPEASRTPSGGKVMSIWPRWMMTFRHIHEYRMIMW